MGRGLTIDEKEFKRLPVKQQNLILYQNTEELKKMVSTYTIQQRVSYIWLTVITGIGVWLANKILGGQ